MNPTEQLAQQILDLEDQIKAGWDAWGHLAVQAALFYWTCYSIGAIVVWGVILLAVKRGWLDRLVDRF